MIGINTFQGRVMDVAQASCLRPCLDRVHEAGRMPALHSGPRQVSSPGQGRHPVEMPAQDGPG